MTDVAADQRPLIEAFRANGGQGFHQLGVAAARTTYETSCARNGLPEQPVGAVTDLVVHCQPDVTARLYRTTPQDSAPVILFVHGGGWVMGGLRTHDTMCRYLAVHTGSVVLAVDYRLAPEHPFPAALDDVRAALQWVHTHGPDHGVDPTRIVVAGDSAGGHLAADVAQHDETISAQVLLYPVTSAHTDTSSYHRITEGFPLTAATMEWFLDTYTSGDTADRHIAVRDLTVEPRPIPTFLCTVGLDPLAAGGLDYARALADRDARVHHIHLPHHAHGMFTSAGAVPTGEQVLAQACAFISAALQHSDSHRPPPGAGPEATHERLDPAHDCGMGRVERVHADRAVDPTRTRC